MAKWKAEKHNENENRNDNDEGVMKKWLINENERK